MDFVCGKVWVGRCPLLRSRIFFFFALTANCWLQDLPQGQVLQRRHNTDFVCAGTHRKQVLEKGVITFTQRAGNCCDSGWDGLEIVRLFGALRFGL